MSGARHVQNPHFAFETALKDGRVVEIRYQAPIRGRGLKVGNLRQEDGSEVFDFFLSLHKLRSRRKNTFNTELTASCRKGLERIGFFVSPSEVSRSVSFPRLPDSSLRAHLALRKWKSTLEGAAVEFRTRKYVSVRGLAAPRTLVLLKRYYRRLVEEGFLALGDNGIEKEKRFIAHNEKAARWVHRRFMPFVKRIVGEPIKPSYAFFSSYQPGALLRKHVDRSQCEFSVSLLVDFRSKKENFSSWPLYLETAEGRQTAVHQTPGDGLIYKGTELPHYRKKLPKGCVSSSLFLHYVRSSFRKPLD